MATERIDVVNYALSLLGANAITSIEDDAREAQVMKSFYPLARDGLLEDQEWSFAMKFFQPAQSAQPPDWGWNEAFPIPSDVLRVTRVDRNAVAIRFDDMTRNQIPHEVVGREIWCNEKIIFAAGVRRIDDEGIYSSTFVEAFATKLALLACLPLTESNTKLQIMATLHTSALRTAKSRDGMQSTSRPIRSQWIRGVR